MPMDVVDFRTCSLDVLGADLNYTTDRVKTLAETIYRQMARDGFVYLKNHGLNYTEIKQVTDRSKEFFALPIDIKKKYGTSVLFPGSRKYAINKNIGWTPIGSVISAYDTPGNLNEAINFSPILDACAGWPHELGPGFKQDMIRFFSKCDILSNMLLRMLAIGLGLEDISTIARMRTGSYHKNCTALRFIQYPPLTKAPQARQQRLAAHTDIGFVSLLFQDTANPLETPDGNWIPSTHTDDTMLVIAGDALQRLTSDKIVATPHRLVAPGKSWRRSIVFFAHPDDDCIIESIDGSGKYPPIYHMQPIVSKFLTPETGWLKNIPQLP